MNSFAALLILVAPAFAQLPTSPAPIPAPILSAQKVFLANGGSDLNTIKNFQGGFPTDEPYDSTYAALQAWGHWKLVASPENADLVLDVRSIAPANFYSGGMAQTYSPQIELKIYDAKSHFLLWAFTQPIHGALLEVAADKNYAAAVQGLITQLKLLTNPATSPTP